MGRKQLDESRNRIGIVAIVDDDEPLREALGSVLKAAGYSIDTFASAEEFLNFPSRDQIACLILDVRLPGMSGIELQRRLVESGSTIPVIFITAHGDAPLREVVMKAGAAGFLNKPVRSDALLNEIRSAFGRADAESYR
jgi:FixJ family two-component response regulator